MKLTKLNLPNFFIIGANKAGTTSLYYYLMQHPDIFMSAAKEPMFFLTLDPVPVKKKGADIDLYYTLKEYMGLFKQAKEKAIGEASTAYLSNPTSILWISKIIPEARLIAILRNPIERAMSDYLYHQKAGIETRTFETAIAEMLDVRRGMAQTENAEKKNVIPGNPMVGRRYLNLGLYGHHVSNVKKYFPDDQLLVIDFRELNNDSAAVVRRICRFLGVREFIPSNLERQNVSGRNNYQIDRVLLDRLKLYFEEDIKHLQTMVEFDVMNWLK
jgi:hypothetical protein